MTKPKGVSDAELQAYVDAYNRGKAYLRNVLNLLPDLTAGGFVKPNKGAAPWIAGPMAEDPGLGLEFLEEEGISVQQKWQAVVSTPVRCFDHHNREINAVLPFVLIAHSGQTDAHLASFARLLIDAPVDPNLADENGRTLLHYCAEYNRPEFAKALLEAGADVRGRCEVLLNATPLEIAGFLGNVEVAHVLSTYLAQKKIESVIAGMRPLPALATADEAEPAPARMRRETFAYMIEMGARDFQSVLYGLASTGDFASLIEAMEAGVMIEKNAKDRTAVSVNNAFQVMRGLADLGPRGIEFMPGYVDRILARIPEDERFAALADVFLGVSTHANPSHDFVLALLKYCQQRHPDFLEQPVPGKKSGQIKRTVLGVVADASPAVAKRILPLLIGPDYPKVPMASPSVDLYTYANGLSKTTGNAAVVFENMPDNKHACEAMGKLVLQALATPNIKFVSDRSSPNRQSGEMVINLIACGAHLSMHGWSKVVEASMQRLPANEDKWPLPVHLCTHLDPFIAEKALSALLNSGALDVNRIWKDGNTLLHYAIDEPCPHSVRTLLAAGVDPTIANSAGKTPRKMLEEGRMETQRELMQILEAAIAKHTIGQVLSAANHFRSTP